ncbi:MAG: hypothetical protein ABSF09_05645 [Candidatus Bathyarchaeia archaeon]
MIKTTNVLQTLWATALLCDQDESVRSDPMVSVGSNSTIDGLGKKVKAKVRGEEEE